MKQNEFKIEYVDIKKLSPYKKNAKKHNDAQISNVAESIETLGWRQPIVADEKGVIIIGHCRYEAAKKLKLNEVPVHYAVDLSEEQVKKLRILDNKLNESDWDFDLLKLDAKGLDFSEYDLDWGGVFDSENEELSNIIEDTPPSVEEVESIVKFGDVWQLGDHRLMCGDSTDKKTVEKLMDGQEADMVFTDPPYGVCATGGRSQTKEKLKMKEIENDDLHGGELVLFLKKFIEAMRYKQSASIYICYPWQTQEEFTQAIKQSGLTIKNCIIWDKKVFGLNGFKGYRPQYEMIYFCCKNSFNWFGDKAQSNIWSFSREIKREEQGNHPTPKPINLISIALVNSSKEKNIVLDVFGGSGSTLIACEQLNRKCYMLELDPKYCDVIIKRWETLTGKKAKLI